MTDDDRMALLKQKCAEMGQSAVSRALGYSATAVSRALSGTYNASSTALLRRVEEIYGATMVFCHVLGEIPLARCAENRRKPFSAMNPIRVRLHRECKECSAYVKKPDREKKPEETGLEQTEQEKTGLEQAKTEENGPDQTIHE